MKPTIPSSSGSFIIKLKLDKVRTSQAKDWLLKVELHLAWLVYTLNCYQLKGLNFHPKIKNKK